MQGFPLCDCEDAICEDQSPINIYNDLPRKEMTDWSRKVLRCLIVKMICVRMRMIHVKSTETMI